jgi:hypothetical protein
MVLNCYHPSGEYNPIAPTIVFIVVFVLSSITGIASLLSSEYGIFKYVDLVFLLFIISIFFWLNEKITSILVKSLRIRNPEMVYKIGLISASLGFIPFNLATKYIKLSGLNISFIDFFIKRMIDGFPAGIVIGTEAAALLVNFHASWFIAIPVTLFELWIVPFGFARILAMQASRPFSEKTKTWYTQIKTPYHLVIPDKKQVKQELNQGNLEIFLRLYPDKKDLKKLDHWGRVYLFIPEDEKDNFYITLSITIERIFYFKQRNIEFLPFYVIDKSTVEILLHRFGHNFSKTPIKGMPTIHT